MRIGIFGGSFDPVHQGHLVVAECCREQAALDRVLFVPAAIQPFKQDRALADGALRAEMLALAVGGNPAFSVSTLELDRGGVSYTVDTLAALRDAHPADEMALILGPDALAGLPEWREPGRILALVRVLAVERDGLDDVAALVREPRLAALLGPARAEEIVADRVTVPALGIRSSDLRSLVKAGRSIRYRTPRAVERFIAAHELYT
ncbi:MAG: nicotinate (nicotinamide) nucleotide adenylyltransferase [Planctomycetia bacterium]|nr:nicotinate (nicotinamide) nucleotide adenylyltransferase [Planctomycetia bacterium]